MLVQSLTPSEAYRVIISNARQLRVNLQANIATMAAGDIDLDYLRAVMLTLKRSRDQLLALRDMPKLDAYVKSIEGDTYVIADEIDSLVAVINAVFTYVTGILPATVPLKPLNEWDESAKITNEAYTKQQTLQLRTELQNVVDLIVDA